MPKTLKNSNGGNGHAQAEFWLKMGHDLGEITSGLKDLAAEFHKFHSEEFHQVCMKQGELEEKLNSATKTMAVIVASATIIWTVVEITLRVLGVL